MNIDYYWTKDHKYYRLTTQANLFGTTDLICSWGSLYSNKGNYKVIHCNSPYDMDQNIKRIARIRKSRGYQHTLPMQEVSNTAGKDFKYNNLEQIADILSASDQYKVIKRYTKPDFYHLPDNAPKQIGVFLDTETTGLSHEKDQILELGMVKFEYTEDGRIYQIVDEFNQHQDPQQPIPLQITELTGITDEMVKGKAIDQEEVTKFLKNVNIIIAHNSSFDRPFFDKMFPHLSPKTWGCSRVDIDWKTEKIESHKLEYLAYKYNFFYEGHRAVTDCLAGLHLLAQTLPISEKPVLQALLTNCHKTRYKIWAKNAPYETKDLLKARGYRWSTHPVEYYKAWMIEVFDEKLDLELSFLRSNIYNTTLINIPLQTITPHNRFKS
jgi:DNA polymerase-3 subunit epsilon